MPVRRATQLARAASYLHGQHKPQHDTHEVLTPLDLNACHSSLTQKVHKDTRGQQVARQPFVDEQGA